MTKINDGTQCESTGVTRTRCTECKRFARLLPGEEKCSLCMGMLPLPIVVPAAGERGGR